MHIRNGALNAANRFWHIRNYENTTAHIHYPTEHASGIRYVRLLASI